MRRLIPLFLLTLAAACSGNKLEHELKLLDKELETIPQMEQRHARQCDSLKTELKNAYDDSTSFSIAYQLQKKYFSNNLDSLYRYIEVMGRYTGNNPSREALVNASYAAYYIKQREFSTAEQYFEEPVCYEELSQDARLFHDGMLFWLWAYDKNKKEQKDSLTFACWQRDSCSTTACRMMASYLGNNKRFEEALKISERSVKYARTHYELATAYNNIAHTYAKMGDKLNQEYYLIQSAKEDIKDNSKHYDSFYRLAKLLYKKKDYDRALKYMQLTINDALASNYSQRFTKAVSANQMFYTSYLEASRKNQKITIVFLAFAIFVIAVVLFFYRNVRKLNTALSKSSISLKERIMIQDKFLGEYLELASGYMGEVDKMRSKIRKSLKSGGIENVNAILREPAYSDEEIKNFYKNFDKLFFETFPEFEREAAKLTNTAKEKLDTKRWEIHLRILALMRLGIVEPGRISSILNISTWTVHSYLSSMRKSSGLSPEDFKYSVQHLCREK